MNDNNKELELKVERLSQEINFKNGLISILSHDFKELFGNFLWLIEAVEQELISQEEFFKLLPQVKRDAQKGLQTVQDSSVWLKTQYGAFEVQAVPIRVFDLFLRLKEKFAVKLKDKSINFRYKGDENEILKTDVFLLEYVLDKILDNAVKYSFPGQDVDMQYFTENGEAVIAVVDRGTGISEKYLSTIFVHGSSVFEGTGGEVGAGLSLKIVKNFVSLMHGNIKIISSENEGTSVFIFIPQN